VAVTIRGDQKYTKRHCGMRTPEEGKPRLENGSTAHFKAHFWAFYS
jgi:hypothetical protein